MDGCSDSATFLRVGRPGLGGGKANAFVGGAGELFLPLRLQSELGSLTVCETQKEQKERQSNMGMI